jgi:DNA-binding NtrC family response regulator
VLADDAIDALERYSWPGNVRELRNVIERAVLVVSGAVIHAGDLPLGITHPIGGAVPRAGSPLVPLEHVEREHIEAVLRQTGWHQGRAADILGISPKTLYRKIREFGLRRPAASSPRAHA